MGTGRRLYQQTIMTSLIPNNEKAIPPSHFYLIQTLANKIKIKL